MERSKEQLGGLCGLGFGGGGILLNTLHTCSLLVTLRVLTTSAFPSLTL